MRFVRDHFFSRRFFAALAAASACFVAAYFVPALLTPAKLVLVTIAALTAADVVILHRVSGVEASRRVPEKLSNGDENRIDLLIENRYPFTVALDIIDELPPQFQRRDFLLTARIDPGERKALSYDVRPVERGEYRFGALNVYAASPIGLALRRYRFDANAAVPVYPSIIQMKKYDLFAVSNRLVDAGIKKIKRMGISFEFDQIRRYTHGDDWRSVNWKATARRGELMVNQYREERSQNVYSVIDMGRTMKMPFGGMTLLDYAVNAALVISNIAIRREDRAGIITFADKVEAVLRADRTRSQMLRILELLYNCRTGFREAGFDRLHATVARVIGARSLILLFTNFETMSSLRRALPVLAAVSRRHLLVAIFFVNTELERFIEEPAASVKRIYEKTIAEKFSFEKRRIVRELERHGVRAILTSPEKLTVDTVNAYLEIKARGMI